jgi:hypothetical protein
VCIQSCGANHRPVVLRLHDAEAPLIVCNVTYSLLLFECVTHVAGCHCLMLYNLFLGPPAVLLGVIFWYVQCAVNYVTN